MTKIYCTFGYECNNNCLFCAVDSEANKNLLLSTADISRFLETLGGMKNVEMELSGGEPTLRPELFYFLERIYANYMNIKYLLLTNGRNFSRMNVAAKISEFNPYSILIPLHGDTCQLHDTITRAPGSFNETMIGIRNLYEHKLNVGLKTVINGLNYERLPQIIELIAKNFPDCPGISINGLDVQGNALVNKDVIGVHLSDAAEHIEKAIDVAHRQGFKIILYSIPPCVLDDDYRKFVGMKRRNSVYIKTPKSNMDYVRLNYGTVEKCKCCRYFAECSGTWHSYYKYYGTDEIKPIE